MLALSCYVNIHSYYCRVLTKLVKEVRATVEVHNGKATARVETYDGTEDLIVPM